MPDYKELFYKSQAELADIAEELKQLVLKSESNMRIAEEKVISEDNSKNSQK